MKKIRLLRLLGKQQQAFVTLCLLQTLVFLNTFCGVIVYQAQRISNAQCSRVESLSDKSLLKIITPTILNNLKHLPLPLETNPVTVEITGNSIRKKIIVDCLRSNDRERIVRIALVSEHNETLKSIMYTFFTKTGDVHAWNYCGMQFGITL